MAIAWPVFGFWPIATRRLILRKIAFSGSVFTTRVGPTLAHSDAPM